MQRELKVRLRESKEEDSTPSVECHGEYLAFAPGPAIMLDGSNDSNMDQMCNVKGVVTNPETTITQQLPPVFSHPLANRPDFSHSQLYELSFG